jgi:hypothetical protein
LTAYSQLYGDWIKVCVNQLEAMIVQQMKNNQYNDEKARDVPGLCPDCLLSKSFWALGFAIIAFGYMAQRPLLAQSTEMVPLAVFIAEPGNMSDPPSEEYVFQRCAALYGMAAYTLALESSPERVAVRNQMIARQHVYTRAALKIEMASRSPNEKRFLEDLAKLAGIYGSRFKDARLRFGNGMADPLLDGDYKICQSMNELVQ